MEGVSVAMTNPGDRPRGYLARWYDPELEVPTDLTIEAIVAEERTRITRNMAIVMYAMTMPRRLGGDASSDELATDKKRCRRVSHAFRQAYRGWDKKSPVIPEDVLEIRQAGAQLVWTEFGAATLTDLIARSRLAATWSILNGEQAWGKTAITNYNNEHGWLSYALR